MGSSSTKATAVDAVVFDWGGTLTPWHRIDLTGQWYAYANVYDPADAAGLASRLREAEDTLWQRLRETRGASGTGHLEHVFAAAGVDTADARHGAALESYLAAWDPHTYTDPVAAPLLRALRADGRRIGVLSNTMWPREHHESVFARDGVLDLIDAAVYTSETPTGKPHLDVFDQIRLAVGVQDPARVAFVGDRPWDDVHGAQQAGMRAILFPHGNLPPEQLVPVDVTPDAVVGTLAEVLDVVRGWDAAA